MPAEWDNHKACLLLYPHNIGVFRSGITRNSSSKTSTKCGPARLEVRDVARAVRDYGKEDVFIFCNTEEEADELRLTLEEEEEGQERGKDRNPIQNQIFVQICRSDDSWCRDTGPTFIRKRAILDGNVDDYVNAQDVTAYDTYANNIIGLDWNFNAYGGPDEGCYWPCTNDQKVAQKIVCALSKHYNTQNNESNNSNSNDKTAISHEKVDIILEGGSFHTDGEGTILTTKECLLNPNRNPNMTQEQIEHTLLRYLGGSKIIWLPFGIFNDHDTNGHVDNIATFSKPGEVVLSWTDDVNDANYERCKAAEDLLLHEVDAKGRNIVVHKIHLPRPLYYTNEEIQTLGGDDETAETGSTAIGECDSVEVDACERGIGERLAASYVNYYLANEAIILPQFGDDLMDKRAEKTMKSIFPTKKIVCVYSREILLGGGNMHCITQQLPCTDLK